MSALVDAFVADLAPLLRESVTEKVRVALGLVGSPPPSAEIVPARPARKRRGRRSSPLSTRLLSIVRQRTGITLDELAVELYGDEGRTTPGRNRGRALAWRAQRATAVRGWEVRAD